MIFSRTGGLTYHLIARRRASSAWSPFRARVRDWLGPWLAARDANGTALCDELIVFGPSAGWTLPLDLLARVPRVIVVEPDPVARFILRRKIKADFISSRKLLPWFSRGEFTKFLGDHPRASVLFTNVLGQIALASPTVDGRDEFLSALHGRRWASYHDLFSGGTASLGIDECATLDGLPARVFTSGDVIDHETAWLSDGRRTQLGLWPLTAQQTHLIGFVTSELS